MLTKEETKNKEEFNNGNGPIAKRHIGKDWDTMECLCGYVGVATIPGPSKANCEECLRIRDARRI